MRIAGGGGAIVLALFVAGGAFAEGPVSISVESRVLSKKTSSRFAKKVLKLTNAQRVKTGLQALRWNALLARAAALHARDMADNDYFSHDSLDGRTFDERIAEQGYVWRTVGENIAAGQPTPKAVVNAWMNSPGHRANILNGAFAELGVGVATNAASTYGVYWVQDFGTPR